MRKMLLWCVLMIVPFLLVGCGAELAAGGAGVGIGAALQHTIAGAKADLEQREANLVAAYNEGAAIGMEQEELDQIEQAIRDTRLAQQTVETGELFLGVDWTQPEQTGGAIGLATTLLLLWFGRKKLKSTTQELAGTIAGINKFTGTHEPEIAGELHDTVKLSVAKAK